MKKLQTMGCLVMLASANVFALQVVPSYQNFTVKPGSKAEGRCMLTNNSEEDLTIRLSSKDWFVYKGNEKFKAPDWLTPKLKEFPLKKGEAKEVEFTVSVPKGAKGELVGMLSFTMVSDVPSNLNRVLSVAMYAAAQGTEELKADMRAFLVTPTTSSLSASALLVNKGNVHIRPSGYFKIDDQKGDTVANIMIPEGRPVYPGKEEAYIGQVSGLNLKPGEYKAHITFTDIDRQKEFLSLTKKFEILENGTVEVR